MSTTIQGVDCASPVTAADAKALAAAGKKFVCRYLAPPGALYDWKRCTAAEVAAIHGAGLALVLVFESSANRALDGAPAGTSDALIAAAAAKSLGAPSGTVIYFAVDFDATAGNQAAINAYLRAAAAAIGGARVGIYGGYWPVSRAIAAGACKWGWQTYGWSGGQWYAGAHLRQYQNGVKLAGLQVDLDEATTADYGQWTPATPTPKPKPKPKARGWVVSFTRVDGTKATATTLHPLLWHSRNPRAVTRGPLHFDRPA